MRKLISWLSMSLLMMLTTPISAQSYIDDSYNNGLSQRLESQQQELQRQRELNQNLQSQIQIDNMERQREALETEQRMKELEADAKRSRTGKPDSIYDWPGYNLR